MNEELEWYKNAYDKYCSYENLIDVPTQKFLV